MKNLFKTLSLVGLSLSLSLSAQTGSNKAKSTTVPQNEAKAAYVMNQEYLAPTSNTGFQSYYGDSLGGFEEARIKKDLMARGLPGWEAQIHMRNLKRRYINEKYNIGPKKVPMPERVVVTPTKSTGSMINGKPIGGGGAVINSTPCVNEDFESTTPAAYTTSNAVTGWTISERTNDSSCNPTNWTAGSSEFQILATPLLNWHGLFSTMGAIPNSPLGGSNVAELNDGVNNTHMTRIAQQFPVTSVNTVFQFAYAGYWEDGGGGHLCCPASGDQPGLGVKMYDCNGNPLSCSSLSISPGSGCQSSNVSFSTTSSASWSNWQVKYIDLTPYVGSCITIEITTTDCAFGGHWGSTLFDARCGGQVVGSGMTGSGGSVGGPVSFCAGANQAIIAAPLGYSSYQWFAPTGSVAAPQGTMSSLTINSPSPGAVYTVQLIAPSGCVFTSTNAIGFSSVTIAGIGSFSTCPGGASGSATVVGNGSGTGYNYTWINAATTATVGTTQVVGNLVPGTYSVVLTAFGSAGCGSAVATVTVGTSPPGIQTVLKPFCGTEAYLAANGGGSNYQWYNGLSAISATAGGTAASYTVPNPSTGQIFWLSRLSSQGCQDSIQFTLVSSPPGAMYISNISKICPGGSNGVATISLSPASGAPAGFNSYLVVGTGTTPAYTSSLTNSSANSYSFAGLSAGSYSVSVFDGSCKYTTTFNLTPYTFSYNLNVTSVSLCPGSNVQAAVAFNSFVSPGEYTFQWSPTTYMFGGTAQNAIISPTIPPGPSSTIIYSVTVTPTVVNCPIVKSMTVTAIHPATPTFSMIPQLCNTFNPYQIVAYPPGGTFSAVITSTNNPLSSGGSITPSLATIGTNTFVYKVTPQYTCSTQATGNFTVSQFYSAALTTTIPPLCSTGAPFNLMNIVANNQNGAWTPTLNTVGLNTPFTNQPVVGGAGSSYTFNPKELGGTYYLSYVTHSSPNYTVCPDIRTITVSVTHTSTPYITPVLEFCTNSSPFNMTVSPTGGGWLVNNGAVSTSGLVSPTLVTVPGMNVTYTVMDGPCLNTNTVHLSVSRFYTAGFNAPIPDLCGATSGSTFNLMSVVQNTVSGSWPANNPGVQQGIFYPSSLPTGVYTLTYSTLSQPNQICNDNRTITVNVLNPVTPTITQVGPFCNNSSTIQLSVNPPNSGHWTTSPYVNANGIFTPSLTAIGSNNIQYIVGTSTCNVHDLAAINIEAFVPATIVSTIPDLCNTSPVLDLSPFTVSNLGMWSGPGISGTNFNPGTVGAGEFTLQHSTNSAPTGLCPDVASISVHVYSLAVPAVTQTGPFCNSSLPVQLQVSPVGGLFGGPNVGIVTLGGKFNPAAALIGDNIINYSITAGPCVAYAQTVIKVEKFVSADFAKPAGPFCKNTDAVNMDSYVQNPGGTWETYQNGPGLLGNMFHPQSAYSNNNNLLIYRTHSAENPGLCPDSAMVRIEVREARIPEVTISKDADCVPFEVVFNDPKTNAGVGIWTFQDGSEPVQAYSTSHIFTTPGNYEVQYDYTDEVGCRALPIKTRAIAAHEVPKADFSVPDEIYITEPQIQLTNLTTVLGNNTYQWKMTGALTATTDVSPVVTISKIGKYQITLTATSIYGCKDEITKTIEVKNVFNVFIPNSFSPNFDGLNDYFMPVFSKEGLDMRSFEMEIFDRWGHSLYHTKDATSKGWDGSIQNKGEPLKEEVYVYRIKYKDMEGNAYNKMGHVSLVK